ncbi:MAG: DNA-binding protein [Candidatus Korarchaeum sp.]|jgi:programmed cell death protein 5|nr:DNA-binding protein [Candidatus Korarchaeum sp.]
MSEDEVLRRLQEKILAEMSERREREEEVRELQRIDAIVKSLLTTDAWQRLKRVELVKPELANDVKIYLIQLYSAGKLTRKLTDDELKALLASLAERGRRDFNIRIV